MARLPVWLESMEKMQARISDAIENTLDLDEIRKSNSPEITSDRRYVFDITATRRLFIFTPVIKGELIETEGIASVIAMVHWTDFTKLSPLSYKLSIAADVAGVCLDLVKHHEREWLFIFRSATVIPNDDGEPVLMLGGFLVPKDIIDNLPGDDYIHADVDDDDDDDDDEFKIVVSDHT